VQTFTARAWSNGCTAETGTSTARMSMRIYEFTCTISRHYFRHDRASVQTSKHTERPDLHFVVGHVLSHPQHDKAAMAPAARYSTRPRTWWTADRSAARAVRRQVDTPADVRMRRREES
jgi:hypothetical protein